MSRGSAGSTRALRVLCILASPATVGVSRPARAHPGAPISFDVLADDAELGQPPDQRPADLGPFPVRADDRHDLLVDEPPDGDEVRPLLVDELLADGEEVRPEGFPEMCARHLRHCWLPSAVRSALRNVSTAEARRSVSAASSRWPP